jgi:hypothetical protein
MDRYAARNVNLVLFASARIAVLGARARQEILATSQGLCRDIKPLAG